MEFVSAILRLCLSLVCSASLSPSYTRSHAIIIGIVVIIFYFSRFQSVLALVCLFRLLLFDLFFIIPQFYYLAVVFARCLFRRLSISGCAAYSSSFYCPLSLSLSHTLPPSLFLFYYSNGYATKVNFCVLACRQNCAREPNCAASILFILFIDTHSILRYASNVI